MCVFFMYVCGIGMVFVCVIVCVYEIGMVCVCVWNYDLQINSIIPENA